MSLVHVLDLFALALWLDSLRNISSRPVGRLLDT